MDDSDVEDENLPEQENNNFNIAQEEWNRFMNYKKQQYRPTLGRDRLAVIYHKDKMARGGRFSFSMARIQ